MKQLPFATLIHLSFFLSIQEKCILYESSNSTNTTTEYLIRITEIKRRYSRNLTCGILNQPRFRFLKVLQLDQKYDKCDITDLNQFADTLEELNIDNFLNIKDEGIVKLLKLKKLNAFHNSNITHVNHFVNLTHLDIGSYYNRVSDEGISKLRNLETLYLFNNDKITTLKQFTKLKEIWIGGCNFKMDNNEISSLLFLEKIYVCNMDYNEIEKKELIINEMPPLNF